MHPVLVRTTKYVKATDSLFPLFAAAKSTRVETLPIVTSWGICALTLPHLCVSSVPFIEIV